MFISHSKEEDAKLTPKEAQTKSAILVNKLLSEPLLLIFSLVGFILCKSLNGTALQLSILTMLNPGLGLLILYWSSSIHLNPERLSSNLIWSGILARMPFLFFPWIKNPWLFIACAAVYMFFYRASSPAWMEVIKVSLPKIHRNRIYSLASALSYAEGLLISLWVIPWLKRDEMAWRWCFPIAAIIGMTSVFVQNKIIPLNYKQPFRNNKREKFSLKDKLIRPWKEAYLVMSKRPDFTRFQVGFFLCGFGLVMSSAVLPLYCVNILNVSLSEYATARLVCMCIGYVLFSKFWSRKISSLHIFEFMVYVMTCFILFAIFIVIAAIDTRFLYMAFFIYGIAQAGSHLSWNLSGPIFAKEENSSVFTSINVLMVGIRGCLAPVVGALLYLYFSPYIVYTIIILLSFLAIWVMIRGLSKHSFASY